MSISCDLLAGLSDIGSCVYSVEHKSTVLVRYNVTGSAQTEVLCQQTCLNKQAAYFIHVASISGCLCGYADPSCTCNSCEQNLTLKPEVRHTLSGFSITVTSPALAGVPVKIDVVPPVSVVQFEWMFGDGSDTRTTSTGSVSHTYVISGRYRIEVSMCYNVTCQTTSLPVRVVSLDDSGDLACGERFVQRGDTADVKGQFSLASGVEVVWHKTSKTTGLTGGLKEKKKEMFLFHDALSTFYLRLFHVGKRPFKTARKNPTVELIFLVSSKGSFICTIPQTV